MNIMTDLGVPCTRRPVFTNNNMVPISIELKNINGSTRSKFRFRSNEVK